MTLRAWIICSELKYCSTNSKTILHPPELYSKSFSGSKCQFRAALVFATGMGKADYMVKIAQNTLNCC